jgi:hypothetical protein
MSTTVDLPTHAPIEITKQGAARENDNPAKGRPDLISPHGFHRLAVHYALGHEKYKKFGDRNWEKGLSITRCVGSILRHTFKYLAGYHDEDHLAAIAWNAFAIMHFEHEINVGKRDKSFMDIPTRRDLFPLTTQELREELLKTSPTPTKKGSK